MEGKFFINKVRKFLIKNKRKFRSLKFMSTLRKSNKSELKENQLRKFQPSKKTNSRILVYDCKTRYKSHSKLINTLYADGIGSYHVTCNAFL